MSTAAPLLDVHHYRRVRRDLGTVEGPPEFFVDGTACRQIQIEDGEGRAMWTTLPVRLEARSGSATWREGC